MQSDSPFIYSISIDVTKEILMSNSPKTYSHIKFRHGTIEDYNNLEEIDNSTIYFITDTTQIYLGGSDYTHSMEILESIPTDSDKGESKILYVCTEDDSLYAYVDGSWTHLSGIISLSSGDGMVFDSNPITYSGTISHAVPSGAKTLSADTTTVKLKLGESFTTNEIETDSFGHVVGRYSRTITLPAESELSHLFEYKGTVETVDDLPDYSDSEDESNIGDVYYISDLNAEYVYIESGWEELGPFIDLSVFVEKVTGNENYVAMFTADGSITSAGYTNTSGVKAGTYGSVESDSISVPQMTVDKYGRVTKASDLTISIVDSNYAADSIAYILETYM